VSTLTDGRPAKSTRSCFAVSFRNGLRCCQTRNRLWNGLAAPSVLAGWFGNGLHPPNVQLHLRAQRPTPPVNSGFPFAFSTRQNKCFGVPKGEVPWMPSMGHIQTNKISVEPGMRTTLNQVFGCLDVTICICQVWEGFLPCALVLAKIVGRASFCIMQRGNSATHPGLKDGDYIVVPQNWVQTALHEDIDQGRGLKSQQHPRTQVTPREVGFSPDWNEPLVVHAVALWNVVARQGNFCAVLSSLRFHPRFYGGSIGHMDGGHTIPSQQMEGWSQLIEEAREDSKRMRGPATD